MAKVNYEILKKFCTDDKLRPTLQEPRLVNDYWCASDSKRMIMVPSVLCCKINPKKTEGSFPNFLAVLDPGKIVTDYKFTLDDLRSAIDGCYKVEEVVEEPTENVLEGCEACIGEGQIDHSVRFREKYYEYYCECPVCHGCGKVPVSKDYDPNDDIDPEDFEAFKEVKTGKMILDDYLSVVEINDRLYRAVYLTPIVDLMERLNAKIAEFVIQKNGMIVIKVKQAWVGVMPLVELPDPEIPASHLTTTMI